jgi:nucleoside diphosphate kinase
VSADRRLLAMADSSTPAMVDLLTALPPDDWAGPRELLAAHRETADALAMLLIRPDAVYQGQIAEIVAWLEKFEFTPVATKVVRPHARLLEELYRYTQVRLMAAKNRPMWWFTPRYYELAPAVAVVVRRDGLAEPASAVLSELKGPANPALTRPGQLRFEFGSQNMVMCVVHCSDATESMLRESCLFFGVTAMRRLLDATSPARVDVEIPLADGLPCTRQPNFHQVLAGLQARITARLAGREHGDLARRTADALRQIVADELSAPAYTDRTAALLGFWADPGAELLRCADPTRSDETCLLHWTARLTDTSSAYADLVLNRLRDLGYEFDHWEELVLETGFGFHDWISRGFRPATADAEIARRDLDGAS